MKAVTLFKVVLIAGLVFQVFSIAAGLVLVNTLPPLLRNYLADVANKDVSAGYAVFLLSYFVVNSVLMLVNYYGLWKFRSWARVLNVVLTLVTVFSLAFTGPVVMAG
jgi:uncharacterized membrane protein (DUF2068 family)